MASSLIRSTAQPVEDLRQEDLPAVRHQEVEGFDVVIGMGAAGEDALVEIDGEDVVVVPRNVE